MLPKLRHVARWALRPTANQKRSLSSNSASSKFSISKLHNGSRLTEIHWADSHISNVRRVRVGARHFLLFTPRKFGSHFCCYLSAQVHFHNVWLRDHCRCPKCVEPSSGQRLRTRADLPDDLSPKSVTESNGTIQIEWADGHISTFQGSWLRENCYSQAEAEKLRMAQTPQTWTKSSLEAYGGVPTFQYDDVMKSDEGVWEWMKGMNKAGLSIIKNAPTQEGTIVGLTERIAYIRSTMYGTVFDVKSVPNPINVAYTSFELPPHMDLCYYEAPPGLQLLHCLRFDQETGGESTFIDGFQVIEDLRKLKPDSFAVLSTLNTEFYKFDKINMMRYSRPVIILDANGDLVGMNYSPNFEAPLRVPEDQVERFYRAYSDFTALLREPKYEFATRLSPGDVACFNNRRVFHARKAFDENAGTRHLQGTYVDLDEYSNRYRTLQRRFGTSEDILTRSGNLSH